MPLWDTLHLVKSWHHQHLCRGQPIAVQAVDVIHVLGIAVNVKADRPERIAGLHYVRVGRIEARSQLEQARCLNPPDVPARALDASFPSGTRLAETALGMMSPIKTLDPFEPNWIR